MTTDTNWTDATVARLRALWAEGHSTAEIGRRMGITKNAVVGKAHRLVLPGRPSPIRHASQARPSIQRTKGPTLPTLATTVVKAPNAASSMTPAPAQVPVAIALSRPAPRTGGQPCCWPIGEPGRPGFRFCDGTALHNKPYCAEHAAISYVPLEGARNRADGPSLDRSLRRLAG